MYRRLILLALLYSSLYAVTDSQAQSAKAVKATSSVYHEKTMGNFSVHPNPSIDKNVILTYRSVQSSFATVKIVNVLGRDVLVEKVHLTSGDNTISLPLNLDPGIYYIHLIDNEVTYKEKLLIR